MIRRFVVLRRKPGMSVAEFRAYWRDVHGKLIASLPGLRRYVQYHVRSERLDAAEPEIDGIAELWFDSFDAQQEAYESEAYAAVVRDEPNLFVLDSRHIHPVMAEDVVVIVGDAEQTATTHGNGSGET